MNTDFVKPLVAKTAAVATAMIATSAISAVVESRFPWFNGKDAEGNDLELNSKKAFAIHTAKTLGTSIAIALIASAAGNLVGTGINMAWESLKTEEVEES